MNLGYGDRIMCRYCIGAGCDYCAGTGWLPAADPVIDTTPMGTLGTSIQGFAKTLVATMERAHASGHDAEVSPAEARLATALIDAGVEDFQQEHKIGPFFADFYFDDVRLVVEVDGHEYHQDTEKDQRRTDYLIEHGVAEVLRLRALQVFTQPTACVDEIVQRIARLR